MARSAQSGRVGLKIGGDTPSQSRMVSVSVARLCVPSSVKSKMVAGAISFRAALTTAEATSSIETVWIIASGSTLGCTKGMAAAARNNAVPP